MDGAISGTPRAGRTAGSNLLQYPPLSSPPAAPRSSPGSPPASSWPQDHRRAFPPGHAPRGGWRGLRSADDAGNDTRKHNEKEKPRDDRAQDAEGEHGKPDKHCQRHEPRPMVERVHLEPPFHFEHSARKLHHEHCMPGCGWKRPEAIPSTAVSSIRTTLAFRCRSPGDAQPPALEGGGFVGEAGQVLPGFHGISLCWNVRKMSPQGLQVKTPERGGGPE